VAGYFVVWSLCHLAAFGSEPRMAYTLLNAVVSPHSRRGTALSSDENGRPLRPSLFTAGMRLVLG
jgi:hypothetical protein